MGGMEHGRNYTGFAVLGFSTVMTVSVRYDQCMCDLDDDDSLWRAGIIL